MAHLYGGFQEEDHIEVSGPAVRRQPMGDPAICEKSGEFSFSRLPIETPIPYTLHPLERKTSESWESGICIVRTSHGAKKDNARGVMDRFVPSMSYATFLIFFGIVGSLIATCSQSQVKSNSCFEQLVAPARSQQRGNHFLLPHHPFSVSIKYEHHHE